MSQKPLYPGALLLLAACGPREGDARKYLEEQGFTSITDMKKDGASFTFSAKKGKDACKGTVTITKGIGSTQQSQLSTCGLDTSSCKAGAADVCLALANELYEKDAKIFPREAAPLYRTACADGKADGCARAAEFEQIGKAWDAVRELAKKGCDLGSGDACRRLANTEIEGNGTAKNVDNGIALDKRACDLGSMAGCRGAAGLLVDGEKPTEAIPLAEKACAAKFDDGCFVLGAALFDAKRDYPRALGHLDDACKNDTLKTQGFACNLAGVIAITPLGMKRDAAHGIASFEAACTHDYPEGCSNAGKMYRLGANGVKKDKEKGAELLAKACTLGKKEACDAK